MDKIEITIIALIGLSAVALALFYFFPNQSDKVSGLSSAIKRMAVGH